MTRRATIDTNIFFYALDNADAGKRAVAETLIDRLRGRDCSVALQVAGELYAALTRKMRLSPWESAQAARNTITLFPTFGYAHSAVSRALAEAGAGRFSYWDALFLASAHDASCHVCFSEDMKDGAKLGNVEVINPFGKNGLSDRALEVLAE